MLILQAVAAVFFATFTFASPMPLSTPSKSAGSLVTDTFSNLRASAETADLMGVEVKVSRVGNGSQFRVEVQMAEGAPLERQVVDAQVKNGCELSFAFRYHEGITISFKGRVRPKDLTGTATWSSGDTESWVLPRRKEEKNHREPNRR